ncbi:Molybdenum cofactor sulfurase [Lasiodiplodia hormozganensis]|uniref:Molybdenum cofactor sulfurase n=1 Tax=Lasiodiplodia hormozganensis TaxID=869390 RepID=A0AA39YFP7_9PEZI|nr:Molybdenum cofactor sulfurase [Lasiodiplodia hormozganensis]
MKSSACSGLDAYNSKIEGFRDIEYPSLKGVTYLDYGGSAIPAKSLLEDAAADLSTNLYGNPHSACAPSALAGRRVDEIREQVLRFFNADPKYFDLVFVANATAALKLVMDCFKDHCDATQRLSRCQRRKFWYGYHRDAHNSLVGIRELAEGGQHCFSSDQEVEAWIHGSNKTSKRQTGKQLRLFAYPGQSNMTGRRLPLSWPSDMRASPHTSNVYTLLDAAALATTSPLDFSDPASAPDFTCLSFYKIFGSPDLGALIIRTTNLSLPTILSSRRYFGGGTVDMVTTGNTPTTRFHAKKGPSSPPHAHLEDGTLPFHSIIALSTALSTHARLYTSMRCISAHTSALTAYLHASLAALRHASSPSCSSPSPLLTIYNDHSAFADPRLQGPMIAFNVLHRDGRTLVPPAAVERAADACRIYVRSGSLCNPGGAARYLGWEAAQLRALYEREGLRCSDGNVGVIAGRATGVVRVSLGAASTRADVDALVGFLRERFGGGGGRETGVGEEDSSGEERSEEEEEEEDAVRVVGKERVEDSGSTEDSSAEEGGFGGEKKKTERRRWMMMHLLSSCHRGMRKSSGIQQQ